MTSKSPVVVDPHFRSMQEIFAPADLERLYAIVEVIWGRDEPMPLEEARGALKNAIAIVTSGWRYDALPDAAVSLRAIMDVSGGFPQTLDYAHCFARGIRVLSAAPAFGPQVAEMALAMALLVSRVKPAVEAGWNIVFPLALAYTIQGLAVARFVAIAFEIRAVIQAAIVILVVCMPILLVVFFGIGFFDAWYDFRRRVLAGLVGPLQDDESGRGET